MELPRTVYAIRHDPTGKIYVGSSSMLDHRINNHMNTLRANKHQCKAMQADYNEFGGSYTVFILDEIIRYEDKDLEYVWMERLQTRDPAKGYNGKDNKKPFDLEDCEKIRISPNEKFQIRPKRETVGQRIHDRRVELGLSVNELAARIGKGRSTVYRYEQDEIGLDSIIPALARELGTTPTYLLEFCTGPQNEIAELFEQLNETGRAAALAAVKCIRSQPCFRFNPKT